MVRKKRIPGPRPGPPQWLQGVWKSDRERTLKEWRFVPGAEEGMRKILERDLGTFRRAFSPKQSTATFRESVTRQQYRVVWFNKESIFIVHGPKHREAPELIHFLSHDEFAVNVGANVEYFRRVDGTSPSGAKHS